MNNNQNNIKKPTTPNSLKTSSSKSQLNNISVNKSNKYLKYDNSNKQNLFTETNLPSNVNYILVYFFSLILSVL